MNDTIHKLENGDFTREVKEIVEVSVDKLRELYDKRLKLYKKGGNDESLNDEIRSLQAETNYKIRE
jgi:hypothetical protein